MAAKREPLLLTRHRAGSDQLPLTHEFLSMMLAVRRAGVTGRDRHPAAGLPRRPGVGPEEEGARAYLFQIVRTRALAA
jgi:hypothetical protein